MVKDLSIPVQDSPNDGVSLDRDLNARLNLLKRTVGQPFAAGGGLVDAQPVRQQLSFVNLSSPRHSALSSCYHSACLTPIRALVEPYSIKTDSLPCI